MRDAGLTALIFLAAALLLALGMSHDLIPYDEGLVLVGAMRVADGALPHRDFYANYGPAQFYVVAALFKLFGPSVLVERAWDTIVRAAIVALAFRLGAHGGARREGLIAAGLCLVWLMAFGYYAYPVFPALLFILVALVLFAPLLDGRESGPRLVAAGVALGVAGLFRYDVGLSAFLALGLAVLGHGLVHRGPRVTVVAPLLWLGLGLALVGVPVTTFYVAAGVVKGFVADIIAYPATYYWRMRALPFPGLHAVLTDADAIGVYLPPAVWLAAALAWRQEGADRGTRQAMLATLVLLSVVLYLKGLVRVSTVHMALSIVPALIAAARLPPLASLSRSATWPLTVAKIVLVAGVALPTLLAARLDAGALAEGIASASRASTWAPASARVAPERAPCHPQAGLSRMACFATQEARADAILYVAAHTQPNDTIFVGLDRHDRVFANDNIFYFLISRPPATKYSHMDPGLQTRADIQAFMVEELKTARPKLVVLDSEYSSTVEANDSGRSSGVTVLDEYLRAAYRPVRSFGPFTILAPRDEGQPD